MIKMIVQWLNVVWILSILINKSFGSLMPTVQSPLQISKQWKLLKYNFNFNSPVNDKDFYNPQNVLLTGLAVSTDRIFLGTPRLLSGVPATLSSVPLADFGNSPDLQAYPDWSFHAAGTRSYNCSDLGLVSVYRLKIDSCNRLWALDAGVSRSLEDYEITCPPKILVFDLNTNRVVRRIDFPREVIRGETLFTNLIIDETTSQKGGNCDDVFVYISDTVEPAIIVYDSARDLTWRMTHPAMYPDPDFAQSEIQGQKFILMDGIVGLAFDPRSDMLYFEPLATDRVFSIAKSVLRAGPIPINQVLPVQLVGKKSSQGAALGVSPIDGSVIFSPLTETALATYNPLNNEQTILAYDPDNLQFVADMVVPRHDPGTLYLISSKFHRFFLKNLNVNEQNNRVLKIQLPMPGRNQFVSHPMLPLPPFNFGATNPGGIIFPQSHEFERKPLPLQFNGPDYFTGIRQPFQFTTVGLRNNGLTSPFTALNQGEALPKTFPVTPLNQPDNFLRRMQPNFSGYNYRRFTKSISANETSLN